MRLSLAEIVEKARNLKTNKEKVEWLKQNDSQPLRIIFKMMYDKSIKILLPDTAPPYKESQVVGAEGMLIREARRLKIFIQGGGYDNLPQIKREQLFISLLEDVDKKDALLLIDVLKQKPLTGLPLSVIKESFPELITETKKEDS